MKRFLDTLGYRSALLVFAAILLISTIMPKACRSGDDDSEVRLRFSLSEGQVLKYKSNQRTEMNWHGIEFTRVSTVISELSLDKQIDDTTQQVALKFIERRDRRSRGGGEFEDFDGPVKPEGKTVRITVDEAGRVKEAIGFIIGIKKGEPLKSYVERWFFKLPEDPVKKDSSWIRNIPEDDPEDNGEKDDQPALKGTIEFKLKKFEKKDGIRVAVIEYEADLVGHQVIEEGMTESVIKSQGEVKIAVDGGYIVESKLSVDVKGEVITVDEFSGDETKNGFAQTLYTEIKLED
ncbi:MAG: hypothetical protein JW814_02760 [Candidatus Krumholzibacteriota bacterium]|nr:hypothetical protein [Candidatus Krumholzibacteriota bacterium]